jgi:hypothetical protein
MGASHGMSREEVGIDLFVLSALHPGLVGGMTECRREERRMYR